MVDRFDSLVITLLYFDISMITFVLGQSNMNTLVQVLNSFNKKFAYEYITKISSKFMEPLHYV